MVKLQSSKYFIPVSILFLKQEQIHYCSVWTISLYISLPLISVSVKQALSPHSFHFLLFHPLFNSPHYFDIVLLLPSKHEDHLLFLDLLILLHRALLNFLPPTEPPPSES